MFIDWRLRECNYGRLNGHPASEFKSGREPIYINTPYPGGDSYQDVEQRMRSFLADVSWRYDGRHIAIVSHQAPQLALDVIIGGQSWEQAMANDWRATGNWQPGWEYEYINTPPTLGAND